jgi:MoxR-like ATPase
MIGIRVFNGWFWIGRQAVLLSAFHPSHYWSRAVNAACWNSHFNGVPGAANCLELPSGSPISQSVNSLTLGKRSREAAETCSRRRDRGSYAAQTAWVLVTTDASQQRINKPYCVRSSRSNLIIQRITMVNDPTGIVASIASVRQHLENLNYVCSDSIATAVYLAFHLKKPVLIEGPPGVGKTELAKTTAQMFSLPLIRLQCYEGLDEAKALYEWKYGKQLLYTQVLKETVQEVLQGASGFTESVRRLHEFGDIFFSEEFLEPRPLLRALREPNGCVLLIDEVDKSDHEFESLLLEILSDYQVSIPEIGTIKAVNVPPLVFLTSNNTREISDALKRRCLHLYIPFPDVALEQRIIAARVPEMAVELSRQLAAFIQSLRAIDLKKVPSISETIDWARALMLLHAQQLDPELVRSTLSVILKFQEDIDNVQPDLRALTDKAVKR